MTLNIWKNIGIYGGRLYVRMDGSKMLVHSISSPPVNQNDRFAHSLFGIFFWVNYFETERSIFKCTIIQIIPQNSIISNFINYFTFFKFSFPPVKVMKSEMYLFQTFQVKLCFIFSPCRIIGLRCSGNIPSDSNSW